MDNLREWMFVYSPLKSHQGRHPNNKNIAYINIGTLTGAWLQNLAIIYQLSASWGRFNLVRSLIRTPAFRELSCRQVFDMDHKAYE
jgi:hypothetical protein